jgi:hypothetical protein
MHEVGGLLSLFPRFSTDVGGIIEDFRMMSFNVCQLRERWCSESHILRKGVNSSFPYFLNI